MAIWLADLDRWDSSSGWNRFESMAEFKMVGSDIQCSVGVDDLAGANRDISNPGCDFVYIGDESEAAPSLVGCGLVGVNHKATGGIRIAVGIYLVDLAGKRHKGDLMGSILRTSNLGSNLLDLA